MSQTLGYFVDQPANLPLLDQQLRALAIAGYSRVVQGQGAIQVFFEGTVADVDEARVRSAIAAHDPTQQTAAQIAFTAAVALDGPVADLAAARSDLAVARTALATAISSIHIADTAVQAASTATAMLPAVKALSTAIRAFCDAQADGDLALVDGEQALANALQALRTRFG